MSRPSRTSGPAPEDDVYYVVARIAEAEIREKGSRFLGAAYPVSGEEEARRQVAGIAARRHDATHHAWALCLGLGDRAVHRSQDDGEPAGTAGKPIRSAIEGRGLTDTLVVVTRWFGGVKLGTAGLARCYGAAAAAALDAAGVRRCYREVRIAFQVTHADLGAAQRVVFGAGGSFADEAYGVDARLTAVVRRSQEQKVREGLIAATSGRVQFGSEP